MGGAAAADVVVVVVGRTVVGTVVVTVVAPGEVAVFGATFLSKQQIRRGHNQTSTRQPSRVAHLAGLPKVILSWHEKKTLPWGTLYKTIP